MNASIPETDTEQIYDDKSEQYIPYSHRATTYVVPMFFIIISIVGFVGNVIVVIIYTKHKSMRNAPNTYLFSLSLADLLVILICVPFISTIYIFDTWPFDEVACKIMQSGRFFSVGISVFTFTALSAERYFAIVKPIKMFQVHSVLSALISASFIWTVALSLAAPVAVYSHLDHYNYKNRTVTFCSAYGLQWTESTIKFFVILKTTVYFFLPLLIITIFYTLMARRLLESTKEMSDAIQGGQGIAQNRSRKSAAFMVMICVIVFLLCYLPHYAYEIWFAFDPKSKQNYNDLTHGLRIFGFCLSFVNLCVNPIILYFTASGMFHQYFQRYLFCRRLKIPANSSSTRLSRAAIYEISQKTTSKIAYNVARCISIYYMEAHKRRGPSFYQKKLWSNMDELSLV